MLDILILIVAILVMVGLCYVVAYAISDYE